MTARESMKDERLPFQASAAGVQYERIDRLPVSLLLDNIRSLFNVGSIFRTADASATERLVLSGITGRPPHRGITKTALGAQETVPWERAETGLEAAQRFRERGYEIAVLETSLRSVDLFDWVPRFPVLLVLGNEVEGIGDDLIHFADTHVRIPMLGSKHSLNVATAAGVALFELLRKYRLLMEGRR